MRRWGISPSQPNVTSPSLKYYKTVLLDDIDKIIAHYEQAADCYEADESTSFCKTGAFSKL